MNVLHTHPFIDVWVMNQPRKAFAIECHSWVKIQPDLWQDWSRNNSVSLSTPRCRNRCRIECGTLLVSHWYHWNKQKYCLVPFSSKETVSTNTAVHSHTFLHLTAPLSCYTAPILTDTVQFHSPLSQLPIICYRMYSSITSNFMQTFLCFLILKH